ncbi:MAG: cellulase family glycosylhydrolase [Clostridia bacterium]|nr:cellulase family glycosylhydrolase [Clostridia bacterium]
MKRILSLLVSFILILSVCSVAVVPVSADESAMLHTEGNRLVKANGETVRLIGLNIPYTSWSDTNEKQVMDGLKICFDEWGSNAVRYPVTPKLWFGKNAEKYRALADRVIETVAEQGNYVILDNHSFYLPDEDDIKLWKDLATRYKNHPNVIFELFNEPAGCTWQQYYEGGKLTYQGLNDWGEEADITINSCGMPAVFNAVRSTGAKNVCILPGINWSFDLSFCTEKDFRNFAQSVAEERAPGDTAAFVEEYVEKYFMKETTGNGIMYSTHPYPTKPADWDQYLQNTALEYPVLVGECGPTEKTNGFVRVLTDTDKSYLETLTAYVDQYEMNITPWAWGAWPYLNQEPSNKLSAYGAFMKKYFEKSLAVKAVTLYDKADYSGKSVTLEAGTYDSDFFAKNGFNLQDVASVSAKADAYQYTVTLHEKKDQSGKSYTVIPDSPNLDESVSGFRPQSVTIERAVPQNILPGHATVIADGSVEEQLPENVIDGKNGTFWKNISETPTELVICLDDVYALNRISIAHAAEASMMSVFNASNYTVSVSTDGKNFTRVIDVTDNNLGLCEYKFEQILASYIKIKLTKGSVIDDTNYYLAEVMAYGTKYTGPRTGMNITVNQYKAEDTAEKTESAKPPVILWVLGALVIVFAITSVVFAILWKKKK